MEYIFEFFNNLTDAEWIMKRGGLYLVLIILFVETGLFFGFFLPGDPLLFISGMIIDAAGQATQMKFIRSSFGSEYLFSVQC